VGASSPSPSISILDDIISRRYAQRAFSGHGCSQQTDGHLGPVTATWGWDDFTVGEFNPERHRGRRPHTGDDGA
jgi:hypothetical protein